MRVATYNIHYGVGQDGRYDLPRALDSIHDADIIGLQEIDSYWDRSGNDEQVELIRELMPEYDLAYGPCFEALKRSATTGEVIRGNRRRSGNIILSRYPILTVRNFPLPRYGAAHPHLDIQKSLMEVSVETPLGPLRIYNTHLCHLTEAHRKLQADYLVDVCRRAPDEGAPLTGSHPLDATFSSEPPLPPVPEDALLLGDFNFRPNEPAYEVVAGWHSKIFKRVPRLGGFVDAWVAAGHQEQVGLGDIEEFGATSPGRLRRVDYCFVSESLANRVKSAEVRYDAQGSDHFPVVVDMK